MPADSAIVETPSNIAVSWWWAIILFPIVAYVLYTQKKWIINSYRKIFIKLLVKMGKIEKIYISWDELLQISSYDSYDRIISDCEILERESGISDQDIKKIRTFRENVDNAKKHKKISELLNEAEDNIKVERVAETANFLMEAKNLLETFSAKGKNALTDRFNHLVSLLTAIKLKQFEKRINEAIEGKNYNDLIQFFSSDNVSREGFSKKIISPVLNRVKDTLTNLVETYLNEGKVDEATGLAGTILKVDVFKDDEFSGNLQNRVVEKIKQLIAEKTNEYLPLEAKTIREQYKDFLPNTVLREINKSIEVCENSKEAKIKDCLNKALEHAKKEIFVYAWTEYNKAVELQGEEIEKIKKIIQDLESESLNRQRKAEFDGICAKIKAEIAKENIQQALAYLDKAELVEVDDKSALQKLSDEITKLKTAIEEEQKFFGEQPIVLLQCDGNKFFNIPKKEDYGEDADPYVNVDTNRNWGVISVFDGMGGAGARKYKHADTGEEHTSAWWASRYVKEAVETLMSSRVKGESPITFLEANLKDAIVNKLNEVIKHFPAANAPLLSKMMRKLPTTMALCAYFIDEKEITINCYWSGDSRVYMFDKNKMYFLTKDDADAADGDPFSPANMDLAMNNTICQDRDFVINKSTLSVPRTPDNPLVLIAATDGCFGYFKNPIEFEHTIRQTLDASKQFDDWMPLIKKAIIDNIQQDDFSMTLVEIGDTDFNSTKELLTTCLNHDIFKRYYDWKVSSKNTQEKLIADISTIDEMVIQSKEEANKAKEAIDEVYADISKLEESFSKYGDQYLKFKEGLLGEKEKREKTLSEINETLMNYSEERKLLKEQLEKIQLDTESQNNEWYAEYKELFKIVNPLGIL